MINSKVIKIIQEKVQYTLMVGVMMKMMVMMTKEPGDLSPHASGLTNAVGYVM